MSVTIALCGEHIFEACEFSVAFDKTGDP
jgi:hypothetical protein